MPVSESTAKSILRRHKKIDSWFISRYGMNLYRGCAHNCAYCDGRAEGYYVEGDFGSSVMVKTNAVELLKRELDPAKKRKPFKRSYMLLGGGVGDAYQPAEETYRLSRQALQVFHESNWPVHVLTKSIRIYRDLDILKKINEQNRAIVSFSFSSVDDSICSILEPGVPPPSERLKTMARIKREGIACGMFLLPVVPFITDTPEMLDRSLSAAAEAGADFCIFGGMTLKEGRQYRHFFKVLEKHFPQQAQGYDQIYRGNKWGAPTREYYEYLQQVFNPLIKRYSIPPRVPASLFKDILDRNDLVVVLLEHIHHLLKARGGASPYGYAAYSVSQVKEPLPSIRHELRKLKGVGPTTARLIREILDTGGSRYLESLMCYTSQK